LHLTGETNLLLCKLESAIDLIVQVSPDCAPIDAFIRTAIGTAEAGSAAIESIQINFAATIQPMPPKKTTRYLCE
jgi:hypothetical protein